MKFPRTRLNRTNWGKSKALFHSKPVQLLGTTDTRVFRNMLMSLGKWNKLLLVKGRIALTCPRVANWLLLWRASRWSADVDSHSENPPMSWRRPVQWQQREWAGDISLRGTCWCNWELWINNCLWRQAYCDLASNQRVWQFFVVCLLFVVRC